MRTPSSWIVAISLAVGGSGCAAARPQIRPSSPFTAELGRFFDDSVDYVQNVQDLGGRVAQEWQQQVDGLSRNADLIAIVRIETVVLGTNIDQSRNYRLSCVVNEVILGTPPEDRHVSLRTSEGQLGFQTISGREERVQQGTYVLFVKWYTDGAGDVRAHWHLSPRSPQLIQRIRESSGLNAQTFGSERIVRQD